MGVVSSSEPNQQSSPCLSLSFSLPLWPLPPLRLTPSRCMLVVSHTELPTLVLLGLTLLPMPVLHLLPMLPLLWLLPLLLLPLPSLLNTLPPSLLLPRLLFPSLLLPSPLTMPLVQPMLSTLSPLKLMPVPAPDLDSQRLPPMCSPLPDRLPMLPSLSTKPRLSSSGDTRSLTKR